MSYDSDVVSATGGVGEADWDKIIKLCNRIRDSVGATSMHQAMQSVMKRVTHGNPAVQLHALTLLEACVSNCGQDFQKQLTTSSFQGDVKGILLGRYSDSRVTQRLKELLLSWVSEFKSAPHMKDFLKFVEQLRRDGVSFSAPPSSSSTLPTTLTSLTAPPGAQSSQAREEEDLKKAIQLSLQDKANPPPSSSSSSSSSASAKTVKREAKKVRAIYDFQAAEDNELTFRAGEIITLIDDSDENWWRGETQLGQGLFPASFVSKNLNKDPEPSKQEKKKSKSKNKMAGVVKAAVPEVGGAGGVVSEQKVDLLLDMLKSADVTDTSAEESKTVKQLESEVQAMRPAVEQSLQHLTAQEELMQAISTQFNEALALYRRLLAEGPRLSDTALPTGVQSYSHAGQHGMATHETHTVGQVQPPPTQPGMGTQFIHQNGTATQPHHSGIQPQATFQSSPQLQHGIGTQFQHGMVPQEQSGMGVQLQPSSGTMMMQNGMVPTAQTGMGTDHQPTIYSSSPGQYAMPDMVTGEPQLSVHPHSLQYQPMTLMQQQQQLPHHPPTSSYVPSSYQLPVSMTTQFPLATSQPPPPPTYHPSHPLPSQILHQPLL